MQSDGSAGKFAGLLVAARSIVRSLEWKRGLLLGFVALTICWCLFLLGARVLYLLDYDAYHGDAAFYFTIGKSILNGLIPYRDIFDPKPPGVFILSALSFWLLNSHMLGNFLSIPMLLSVPVILVRFLWRRSVDLPALDRAIVVGVSIVAGSVLALWSSIQAGVWQPESFGNFFGFLFILLFVGHRHRMTLWSTLAAALCVLLAMGSKEPFFLTLFAASIVIDQHPKSLLRGYCIPLCIAALLGVIALLLLGWFDAYVRLYLPTIVGIRIQYEVPVWLRGLYFWKTYNALSYSSILLFPSIIALTAWRGLDVVFLSGKRALPSLMGLLLGAYLSVMAVGLAGNYAMLSYCASLVPYVTALVLLLLLRMCQPDAPLRYVVMVLGSLLLMALAWSIPLLRAAPALTEQERTQISTLTLTAQRLDALLDACSVERYLYAVNPTQPLLTAYTEHSPLNHFPYRQIDNITFGVPFLKKSLERLSQSVIIVVNAEGFLPSDPLGQMFGQYLEQTFTADPPTCAEGHVPIGDYTVLFRYKPTPITVHETIDAQGRAGLEFEY